MKNLKMMLFSVVAMTGVINASQDPNVVQLEQFFIGDCVNDKQQSIAHVFMLQCNNPDVEIRFKPMVMQSEIEKNYPDVPKEEAAQRYFVWWQEKLASQDIKDVEGRTPRDILMQHECKTSWCTMLQESQKQREKELEELKAKLVQLFIMLEMMEHDQLDTE
jgi:hypothetical protein